jgi:hypothetical protein
MPIHPKIILENKSGVAAEVFISVQQNVNIPLSLNHYPYATENLMI